MRTLVLALTLLCLFFVAQAEAQVVVYYQPTWFPLYRCYDPNDLSRCPGGSMPQDLEKVHLWDGWLPSYYYGQAFQRDDRLQVGGWGDVYRTYIKFDLTGLPQNPTVAGLILRSYPRGDGSTTTPFAFCKVGSSWNLSMLWSTQPSFETCWGWYSPPTPGNQWSIDITYIYSAWKSSPSTNHGIMMSPQYNDNRFNMFRSSRYSGDGDRPILAFQFNQPSGMPNFKIPLPGNARWLLTNEIGGYECMGENPLPDTAHQGSNYYSIDFSPTNVKDTGGSYTGNIPVIAAAGGYVAVASYTDANGYYVVIDHDGDGNLSTGYSTRYLHLQSNLQVSVGNTVTQGQLLGYMGNTGNPTTGTHLHFGIRYQDSGSSSVSQLSYAVVDGWIMKNFQTECSVNGSGVPTSRIRYYRSSNTVY